MRFNLIDTVIEIDDSRIVASKLVDPAEPYLQDHFPTFPVMPGVLMLEAMTQAARRLIAQRNPAFSRHVLGSVRALKYGAMVKPGDTLVVEVTISKELGDDVYEFKGRGAVRDPKTQIEAAGASVSGRFTLRPMRI